MFDMWRNIAKTWYLSVSWRILQQVKANDYDELAFLAQFGLVLRLSLPRERPGNRSNSTDLPSPKLT